MKKLISKTDLELLKTETRKIWGFPILELAVGFVVLIAISKTSTLLEIVAQSQFQSAFNSLIVNAIYDSMNSQMLPLGLFSGILVSLSFARDYEQGLMQTLLSLPVSRSTVFIVKIVAVVVPLTLLSWGLTLSVMILNFYSSIGTVFSIVWLAASALPLTFLAVMFYSGIATLIALSLRRTIPSALIAMLTGFFAYYITLLKAETIGPLANYLALSPFKAPLLSLGRIVGLSYAEGTLESSLPTWSFLALTLVYALMFLIPMFIYFIRRFEVRD